MVRCRAKERRIRSTVAKPQTSAIVCSGKTRLFETTARGLDPGVFDESGGRHAGLGAKAAREIARAHRQLSGKPLDSEIFSRIARESRISVRRCRWQFGRLRPARKGLNWACPPGPAQKDDHHARHHPRRVSAEIFLDQRQREIDARGDSAGSVDAAVAHERCGPPRPQRRIGCRELLAIKPMCRHLAIIEKPAPASRKAPVQIEATPPARAAPSLVSSRSSDASAQAAMRDPRRQRRSAYRSPHMSAKPWAAMISTPHLLSDRPPAAAMTRSS